MTTPAKVPPTYKSDPLHYARHKYQTTETDFLRIKIRSVVVWLDKLRVDYLGNAESSSALSARWITSPAFAYLCYVLTKTGPNGALNSIRLGKRVIRVRWITNHIALHQ